MNIFLPWRFAQLLFEQTKLQGVDRELFQHYCQYTYLKSIHYDVVIKNDEDWKHQEKKG